MHGIVRVLLVLAIAFAAGILIEDAYAGAIAGWLGATVIVGLVAAAPVIRRRPVELAGRAFLPEAILALLIGGLASALWRARVAAAPALPEGELVFEGIVTHPVEDGPGPRRARVAVEWPIAVTARVAWMEANPILP